MTESAIDYAALQANIHELEGAVLTEITQRIEERSAQLSFKRWDGRLFVVRCTAVVLCNVSVVDQKAGDSEVIGAQLDVLASGGLELLEKVGYLWDTKQAHEEYFDYPLVHLSINGDTCVAVVCSGVDFR
jgi:hypothetical protein